MKLWDWANQAYARPGAQALCLELQDRHGQCVSFLLWAAWAAQRGRGPNPAGLAKASRLARDWEIEIARPLRAARRALKAPRPGVEAEDQSALYEGLKAQELAAERLLLEALERLAPAPSGAQLGLAQTLAEAAAAWGPAPPDLIAALSRAFSAA